MATNKGKQTVLNSCVLDVPAEVGVFLGCSINYLRERSKAGHNEFKLKPREQVRDSIVVSISACHAEDPGSIPGRGVCSCERSLCRQ